MIAYINERSLEEHGDWGKALRFLLDVAIQLNKVGAVLTKDTSFFFNKDFKQRFNTLGFGKDVKGLIREVAFSEHYYKCWRPGRISSDDDVYLCTAPKLEMLDESLCEAAERTIQNADADAASLSAADSLFKDHQELAILNTSSGRHVILRNISSLMLVKLWITHQRGYYDPTSHQSPKDFQTILEKNPIRFRSTGKTERRCDRKVYEELTTGRLFYVDDGHSGHSAHLEVFSAQYEHLGVADIHRGDLNPAGKINGRRLKL